MPSGVRGGDVIHVRAPDGRINAIIVPMGMGPGSTFTVEFAASEGEDDAEKMTGESSLAPGMYVPVVVAEPEPDAIVADANGTATAVARPADGGPPDVPAYLAKTY